MEEEYQHLSLRKSSDPFVREANVIAGAAIELRGERKLTGTVERIDTALLKALQDELLDMTMQPKLEEQAIEKADELFESFKEKRLKKLSKHNKQLSIAQGFKVNEDEIHKRVVNKFQQEESRLRSISYFTAWKYTIEKHMEGKLKYKFNSKDIEKSADVKHGNLEELAKDVHDVQSKFYLWEEYVFDEQSSEIKVETVRANLFPECRYMRHGTGRANEIKLTVNSGMLHAILFLNRDYAKYDQRQYNKIRTGNGNRLYKILATDARSLIQPEYEWQELQKKFDTKYKTISKFYTNVIDKSLDRINKELGTSISYDFTTKGKRNTGFIFNISKRDKQKAFFGGDNAIVDEIENVAIEDTFGYFLTLKQIYKKKLIIKDIKEYAKKANGLIEKGEWNYEGKEKELRKEYTENLIAMQHIQELLDMYEDQLGNILRYDYSHHIVFNSSSNERLGDNAIECLKTLEANYINKIVNSHPTLPGLTDKRDEEEISALVPFLFNPTPTISTQITAENFTKYKKQIDAAIARKKYDAFIFDDIVKEAKFNQYIVVEEDDSDKIVAKPEIHFGKADEISDYMNRSIQIDGVLIEINEWEVKGGVYFIIGNAFTEDGATKATINTKLTNQGDVIKFIKNNSI